MEHPYKDATDPAATVDEVTKPRNPFIYNPTKAPKAARARPTFLENEAAEVFVTLQNPFLFDLEIQNIELRCVR